MADIEEAVISEIILSEDIKEVTDRRITSKFFTTTEHRRVFELVMDHFREHHKVPDESVIQRAFPKYEIVAQPEPLGYYLNQLQDRFLYRSLMTGLEESVTPELQDSGPDQGHRIHAALTELLNQARHEVPVGLDEDLFGGALEYLLPEIELRRKYGYLRGIPTGFDQIDRATGGYQPEQLIFLVGFPKAGKSWMLLKTALVSRFSGRRLLFVTFEMSNSEQRDRAASLVSGVSFTHILNGTILPNEVATLTQELKRRETLEGFTMIHDRSSMMTLDGVAQKIVEYSPDVVFIDGVYMMEDQSGEPAGSPRALTNITRGLKRIAQNHGIPIVATTQALSHKVRSGGPLTADAIGYSSSFLQDADVILGVETKTPNISLFKVMLSRSGPLTECYVKRDLDHGVVEEMDKAVALSEIQNAMPQDPVERGKH